MSIFWPNKFCTDILIGVSRNQGNKYRVPAASGTDRCFLLCTQIEPTTYKKHAGTLILATFQISGTQMELGEKSSAKYHIYIYTLEIMPNKESSRKRTLQKSACAGEMRAKSCEKLAAKVAA